MSIYTQKQEVVNKAIADLVDLGELLDKADESKAEKYGFVPGLDMENERRSVLEQIQNLREGIFQVLFTGPFTAGKSTLLNALMHKDVLGTGINPETAVITKIVFNADEKVIVYKKEIDKETDKQKYEEMTLKEFFKKFSLDEGDEINYNLFNEVDYVRLQQPQDGIGGSMVQLVDSPGTGHTKADDSTARIFAEKASAVVFLINATHALEEKDMEYIRAHFITENAEPMKNVFFVVTWYDAVQETEKPKLKQRIRNELNDVFLKSDGTFDEDLFDKRVFYVNAYYSLMGRTGQKVKLGRLEFVPDDIEDETGVPEFEQALGSFLVDESRDKDALAAYIPKILGVYKNAEKVTAERYEAATKDLEKLKSENKELEDEIERVTRTLNDIVETTNNTVKNIILDAKDAYNIYAGNVAEGWDEYFNDNPVPSISIMGTMWDRIRGKDCEARFKPILDGIGNYLNSQYEELDKTLNDIIKNQIDKFEAKINNYELMLNSLNIDLDDMLIRVIATKGIEKVDHGDTSFVKIILAAALGDPELVVNGVMNRDSMSSFILELVKTNVIDFLKVYLLDILLGPYGLILFVINKIWKTIVNRSNATSEILANAKPMIVEELSTAGLNFTNELELKLSEILISNVKAVCTDMKTNLNSKKEEREKIVMLRESKSLDAESMKAQMDNNLSKMKEIISSVAKNVNYGELTFE